MAGCEALLVLKRRASGSVQQTETDGRCELLSQDLARWKNRRRSTSQELIKKEEERKRMEKRMKGNGVNGNKRKSIKTYKEIVEEK